MKKRKNLMERILAILLSVSLILTIINLTAFAMPFDEDCIRIVGFGEIGAEVREQKLKVGASESDIVLPDNLLVTVEKYKLLEKIDSNELEETKDEKKKNKKSEGEVDGSAEASTNIETKDAAAQGMSSETGQATEGNSAMEGSDLQ